MDVQVLIETIMIIYVTTILPIATPLLLAYFTVTQYIGHSKTKKTSNLVIAILLTIATLSSIIIDLLAFSPILNIIWRWLIGYAAFLCPIIITICLVLLIIKYRKQLSTATKVQNQKKSRVMYILSLICLIVMGIYFILLIVLFIELIIYS